MFSGIGYGIMEVWKEKNTNGNILRRGDNAIKSVSAKWSESVGTLKHQNKRRTRLLRIRQGGKGLGLRLSKIMVVSVPVAENQK